MIDNVEKFCGGFAERLPLLKNIFKGDKVIWALFFLLNVVEVCSSPMLLHNMNVGYATVMGTVVLALCVIIAILVANIHYSYFKVIVPLGAIVGFMLLGEITIKVFSPVVVIEAALCVSILVRAAIIAHRCREVFPSVLAIGVALLMTMRSVICIGDPGISTILNNLFAGTILSASRAT